MTTLQRLAKSFRYAARGIARVAREEQNFRIQLSLAALTVALMFLLGLSPAEKALLLLAAGFVLVLELANSIVERMVDLLQPRVHHHVEEVKDTMAGAVLVASVGAALIGLIIFLPHLLALAER
jgi:undecaprenol kinase